MMNPMQVDGHLTDRGYKEVRRKMDVTGHCTNLSLIASIDTYIDRINRYILLVAGNILVACIYCVQK